MVLLWNQQWKLDHIRLFVWRNNQVEKILDFFKNHRIGWHQPIAGNREESLISISCQKRSVAHVKAISWWWAELEGYEGWEFSDLVESSWLSNAKRLDKIRELLLWLMCRNFNQTALCFVSTQTSTNSLHDGKKMISFSRWWMTPGRCHSSGLLTVSSADMKAARTGCSIACWDDETNTKSSHQDIRSIN